MGKIRYVVEAIHGDGGELPSGDLIKKFDGKKLVSQKFVPKKKLKKIADDAKKVQKKAEKLGTPNARQKVIYKTAPQQDKQIVVKDNTKFGHLLKVGVGVGAGAEIGMLAVDALVDGIAALF